MCEEAFGNCADGCCSSTDKMCEETFGDALDRCCSLPCFGKENQEDYLKMRKAKKIATVRAQLESLQSPHPHDTDAMKEWRAKEIVKTKVELADLTGEEPPTVDPLQLPLLHEFELHELDVSITHSFSWAAFTLFMCGKKSGDIYFIRALVACYIFFRKTHYFESFFEYPISTSNKSFAGITTIPISLFYCLQPPPPP
jgi:hypothetical protein